MQNFFLSFPLSFPGVAITNQTSHTLTEFTEKQLPFDVGLLYIPHGCGSINGFSFSGKCILALPFACTLNIHIQEKTSLEWIGLRNATAILASIASYLFIFPIKKQSPIDSYIDYLSSLQKTTNVYFLSNELYAFLMKLQEETIASQPLYSSLILESLSLMQTEFAFLDGIDDVARTLMVSSSHFIRKFKAEVGISPGKYLQNIRIENAKLLLKTKLFSIEIIASLTGYACSNYFCKVFRRQTGQTPLNYQKRYAAQPSPSELAQLESITKLNEI